MKYKTLVVLMLSCMVRIISAAIDYGAFFAAVSRGDTGMVQTFLDQDGFEINRKNDDGETGLFLAVRNNRANVVTQLCSQDAIDVNVKNVSGHTPFIFAVVLGRGTMVDELLKAGVIDVNEKITLTGDTALIVASRNGYRTIVQKLLAAPGIDKALTNNAGQSAWDVAKAFGRKSIASLLEAA